MGSFTWSPTDPNTVWAGSLSGPYKSSDGGRTWAAKRAGMPAVNGGVFSAPVEQVLFDPNANRLLAFSGNRRNFYSNTSGTAWNTVWQSTDGGETWTRRGTVGTAVAAGVRAAAYVGDDTLLAVVSGQGAFRSVDDGANWTAVNTGIPAGLRTVNLVADPRRTGTAYVGLDRNGSTAGGIWKTTDSGDNWSAANTGLTRSNQGDSSLTSSYPGIAISTSNPSVLYSSDNGWFSDGIFRSSNAASSWSAVVDNGGAAVPAGFYGAGPSAFAIAVDPSNANVAFAGTSDRVFRTLDGGATWTDVLAQRQTSGRCRGTGFSGLVSVNVKFNPFADQSAMMSMDDGKLILSSDGLNTFTRPGSPIGNYNGGNDVTFAGPNGSTIYATFGQFGYYDGIARSTNGGANWSYVTKPAGSSGQPTGIYARPDQPASVWAVVGGKLYASTDSGATWSAVGGAIAGASLKWMAADPSSPTTFYITSNQGLWQTTNGSSFSLVSGTPANLDRVVVDPTNASRLYVTSWRTGSTNGGLWRLQGGSWFRLRADQMIQNVAVDPTNPNRIVVATNDHPYHDESFASGVWLSVDGGATWSQQNDGLSMTRGEAIAFDPHRPGRIVFGSYGRGFFTGQVDVTPPTVADMQFDYDAPRQRLVLTFSEPMRRMPVAADIRLANLTTSAVVPASALQLTTLSDTQLQVRWSGLTVPTTVLPNGSYEVSVLSGNAQDFAGNAIAESQVSSFAFLNGDFNRDRIVNFDDLLILAANYQRTGFPFSGGNANYDNAVDFDDLLILAASYGTSLGAPPSRAELRGLAGPDGLRNPDSDEVGPARVGAEVLSTM